MNDRNVLRVAWLLPVAWFYWQPVLSEFTNLFPNTKIFTGLFPGFAKGFENSINVECVGQTRIVGLTKSEVGYGDNFTYLSPAIIGQLFKLKPQVIFSSSFGIWTIIAIFLKPIGRWRVVIAYEGSSPGVDYRNSWLRLSLRRVMVLMSDACITNSHGGKAYLVELLYAKAERVFVQPYEIPVPETFINNLLLDEQKQESLKKPIFLFVGHLVPRKGLDYLLDACAILQNQGYSNYTILVVGDGPQKSELAVFCQQHNLTGCIQWEGRIEYDQIGAYFQSADVFVMPTLEDTWGVVVLEAMLFGKAILCSKGAGTSELIIHGENGYVFDPQDSETLAMLMRKFIDRPDLATIMGEKAKQTMAEYTAVFAAQVLSQATELVMKSS
jgi:glycosyltransferase involved in cell wall biosynthesis